jgi:hypothetical protein
MGQARTEDERAFVEQLYEQAVPRLGIDRNA